MTKLQLALPHSDNCCSPPPDVIASRSGPGRHGARPRLAAPVLPVRLVASPDLSTPWHRQIANQTAADISLLGRRRAAEFKERRSGKTFTWRPSPLRKAAIIYAMRATEKENRRPPEGVEGSRRCESFHKPVFRRQKGTIRRSYVFTNDHIVSCSAEVTWTGIARKEIGRRLREGQGEVGESSLTTTSTL